MLVWWVVACEVVAEDFVPGDFQACSLLIDLHKCAHQVDEMYLKMS